LRISIIGAGLQCKRRAEALKYFKNDVLVSISSKDHIHSVLQAELFGCEADLSWQNTIARTDIDAVIICTPPSLHAEIAIAAMMSGKHVLCEKPLSKTVSEAESMVKVAIETQKVLKCGFNHRHHPAIYEAKKRLDSGEFGKILFARARYGICGRPEYGHEWRSDPALAAGGQFIEQGSHLIDLIRWFMGEVSEIACMNSIHYFKDQVLEDDGFAILRMLSGGTASIHTSLAQWQNMFSFEISGEEGYARIDGLGGSYGLETLSIGRRDFDAPFEDRVIQYRGSDISWREEWREFSNAIAEGRQPLGNGVDGTQAMKVAIAGYESNLTKKNQQLFN